ncbi:DUF4153 domain-containing protein [Bacillus sp. T33-2]|uniref:DUF4153 domain-containing protein n=1 Tax=Bacillus sp. T33-2 TaxID=2054168 RepID=UPI000C778EB1|nr:DUF4173 domain-containing protein [Bacillus sp. T33-2]PLR90072.1 DUF4173 domain-containing protein [Bacillus sp. T33-2]
MEMRLSKQDWIFFLICLGLGIVAEISFFHDMIGISYVVFSTCLYAVFFWRFRSYQFANKRIGLLLMVAIWLLSASFLFYSNMVFYMLNTLVIPFLVIGHLVLMTSPKEVLWHRWPFISRIYFKVSQSIGYAFRFLMTGPARIKAGMDEQKAHFVKRVLIGLVISFPLLFVIIILLTSADQQFGRLLGALPEWFSSLRIGEEIVRAGIVAVFTLALFGLFQVLYQKDTVEAEVPVPKEKMNWDGVIAITVLVLLNLVYLLFVVVQFRYFFSETLQGEFTYAGYARRGFFELVLVTLANLAILTSVLTYVKVENSWGRMFIRTMLTLMVAFSGVMLYSAFLRLLMYEEAYGFTFARVLAHSFMIFLMVILLYTVAKVWLERLSLVHFCLITSLIYYTVLNMINIDRIIVEQNLDRFEETEKIDIYYLYSLSYEGVIGLAELYELNPSMPGLRGLLVHSRQEAAEADWSWQSYNLSREKAYERLKKLDL